MPFFLDEPDFVVPLEQVGGDPRQRLVGDRWNEGPAAAGALKQLRERVFLIGSGGSEYQAP